MKKTPTMKEGPLTIEKFISGAGQAAVETNTNWPWCGVDDRVLHTFNLRLAESEYLKLKFIAEKTPHSVHSFIMEVLRPALDQEISRLTE